MTTTWCGSGTYSTHDHHMFSIPYERHASTIGRQRSRHRTARPHAASGAFACSIPSKLATARKELARTRRPVCCPFPRRMRIRALEHTGARRGRRWPCQFGTRMSCRGRNRTRLKKVSPFRFSYQVAGESRLPLVRAMMAGRRRSI